MMGKKITFSFLCMLLAFTVFSQEQEWPKQISSNGTTIKIYQPQVESYSGNIVKTRGAFSILERGQTDPVFGAMWVTSNLETDRNTRTAVLQTVKVDQIKFAGDSNPSKVASLKALIESEVPKWDMVLSLDQLESSIESDGANSPSASKDLSMTPPKIIYADKPSTLVIIDGEPKLKENKEMGVEMVMNTAFTIAKVKDLFYLNGSEKWYTSKNINGPWVNVKSIPKTLDKLDQAIKENDKKTMSQAARDSAELVTPEIIVSQEPAELIQSNGEPDFASIQETALLYMTNTNNDLFMNTADNQYFVLLSGRWYTSASLKGPWTYQAADKLPADFAKIPVGSEKDNVLSSVAGTMQAQDAVMDAEIPQTAKVDRKTATTTVTYEGEPKFAKVDGTSLEYAQNTSSTVLQSGNTYYAVENGIWFQGPGPKGPWTVAASRPTEVTLIQPTAPVYNVKYVYIYETTPQYVYVGYTPGYMGCYIYGGTVIYGTGYHYNPWYGPYYYPRPYTYGFSMHYNPWYGWSMGFHYSSGWFSFNYYGGGYHGGYWGPPMYRPPYYHRPGYPPYYRPPYYPRPGYRPPVATPYRRSANNVANNNNIYRNHRGVQTNNVVRPMPSVQPVTRPAPGNPNTRPSIQPPVSGNPATRPAVQPANPGTGMPSTRPSVQPSNPNTGIPSTRPSVQPGIPDNSLPGTRPSIPDNRLPTTQPVTRPVITDRSGNVFQRDANGWQERNAGGWQNVNQNRQSEINRLNQQQQSIDRGNQRTNNFNQSSRPAPQQRPAPSSGGTRRR